MIAAKPQARRAGLMSAMVNGELPPADRPVMLILG